MQSKIREDFFDQNLLIQEKEELRLKAYKCPHCNKVFFPKVSKCPDFLITNLAEVPLSNIGYLYSYTTVYIPSKNFGPPYTVGYIEFEEGVRVFGQIRIKKDRALKIGMSMKMLIDYLWEEQGSKKAAAYFFEPIDKQRG